MQIRNRLLEIRRRRRLRAAELAEKVGVSRQTIYAIEAGIYVPNTAVSLQLARVLEVGVEELFSLEGEPAPESERVPADLLASGTLNESRPVRVARLGSRWVAVPASTTPFFLPEADGVLAASTGRGGHSQLRVFSPQAEWEKRLVLAGCDPAISVLAQLVAKQSGVELLPAAASSRQALEWLKQGKVHVAGSHLEDSETGEFNLPLIRRLLPGDDVLVVTFARWEEGLVVRPGNPKHLKDAGDLARRGVRIVNREPGSGSRLLLDRKLAAAGVPTARVTGYDRLAAGHLAAAQTVLSGQADCCLATRSAALAFGLDFVPVRRERYDLVLRKASLELPSVQALLETLSRALLRRRLEALAGYDTSETGKILAGG